MQELDTLGEDDLPDIQRATPLKCVSCSVIWIYCVWILKEIRLLKLSLTIKKAHL